MIRMFCDELEIIVPARARSAGTLMCLGADIVLMTKQATLGPIDPSLNGPLNPQIPGAAPEARASVSVEAVRGYIEMAKQDFGVKGSADMDKRFERPFAESPPARSWVDLPVPLANTDPGSGVTEIAGEGRAKNQANYRFFV